MKTIVLEHSKWGPEYLRNPTTGRMCCLGQAALQFGSSPKDLVDRNILMDIFPLPSPVINDFMDKLNVQIADEDLAKDVEQFLSRKAHTGEFRNPTIENALMELNDTYFESLSKHERKKHLPQIIEWMTALFAEAGYKLVYKGIR